MGIRTLIADDEPLARRGIRVLLEEEEDVEIVAECASGAEAVETIAAEQPDLVFLDVQMPDMTGFEVLEALDLDDPPIVVFVTAYDRYALRAFDVHAFGYLLKPVDEARVREALGRVREQIRQAHETDLRRNIRALIDVLAAPAPVPGSSGYLDRIVVRAGGRVHFFKLDEVDWIEAAGDYMCFHVGGKPHYVREKMAVLEEKLDPRRFVRIHRSTIVNLDRIQELRGHDGGGYVVFLRDGTQLKLSRGYQSQVFALLGEVL